MTSPDLLDQHAEDVEELLLAWYAPLGALGMSRKTGDPLPFTLIRAVTGTENPDIGTADPVASVHTLCDKSLGWAAAKAAADMRHRRMLELARYLDTITMSDGRLASVDYVTVFQSPIWVDYEDTQIIRKVGRYTVGLSYVPTS